MADIKRTTEGLEHCLARYVDGLCDDCPYMGEIDKSYMIPMKCKEIIMRDALELLKKQHTRLLTFEEVRNHYSVPVPKLQIEKYNDYAEDIKPLYFEFPSCDGWEVHWRGYDKVSAYLREWEKDYGRTWRCWTDKPTDEQSKAEPWKDGE